MPSERESMSRAGPRFATCIQFGHRPAYSGPVPLRGRPPSRTRHSPKGVKALVRFADTITVEVLEPASTLPGTESRMETALVVRGRPAGAWLVAAAFFIIFASPHMLRLSSDVVSQISALWLVAAVVAAGAVSYRASRFTRGKERRTWRLACAASVAFAFGMAYRVYTVFAFGVTPAPGSFEDVAFVVGLVLFVPVVLLLTEPYEVIGLKRIRNALDFTTMVVGTFAAVYVLLIVPHARLTADSAPVHDFLAVLYAVFSLSFVLYLVTFKREKWTRWEASLLGAAIAGSSAAAVQALAIPLSLYSDGSPLSVVIEGLLGTGFVLIFVAGIQRIAAPPRLRRTPTPFFDLPHWPGVVAMGVGLVGVPALIFAASALESNFDRMAVSISASLIAALITTRGVVVAVENKRLAQLVPTDPLTGLGNMTGFRSALDAAIVGAGAGEPVSVVVFDIDRFDALNGDLGYSAGDGVLHRIANELQSGENEYRKAYRIGGDDFAAILQGSDAVEAYEWATFVSESLRHRTIDGVAGVSLSVGIASAPVHATGSVDLARLAEGASYHAKTLGGGQVVIYDSELVDVLDVSQHIAKLEQRTHSTMVESLAAAVDARDPYTQYHARNVAQLALFFGRELGLPPERVLLLHSAGLLHDVGKIGVPDSVLKKKGPLTDDERALIETHPDLGVKILHATAHREILPWVHAHHERIDGRGYPQGLSGDQIPFEARLLAVCDAFDAMTTDRPYRRGLSVADALDELRRVAGTQLDAELVDLFLILLGEGRARDVRLEPAHPDLRLDSDEPVDRRADARGIECERPA